MSNDEIEKLISKLILSIFNNKTVAGAPEDLFNYFVDQLWEGVIKGYGSDITGVDFDTPDYDMLNALQNDVIRFSSAKDDVMNKAIFGELADDAGHLRSYTEFRKAAHGIAGEHVHTWLKAEYNLVITSAQAASKWVSIQAHRETLPLLKFDAVIDSSTTEICRNFDGVTLPIDHPFWDEYYIPNHWGERSLIRQLEDGEISDASAIVFPEKIPAMFKVNLAKRKLAVPPDHPYYNGK